jgi:signal transduction histidine kinase
MINAARAIAIYALALVLPLVLFLALQEAFSVRAAHDQIEAETLGRTREINALIDGRVLADQSALQVLASSRSIAAHDWRRAAERIIAVQRGRPGWRSVDLTDIRAGREIWETRDPSLAGRPLQPWIARYLADRGASPFTGIVRGAPDCPCVAIHVPVIEAGARRYLITLELAPQVFQAMLVGRAPRGSTSAVVDRQGLFIARTVDYGAKLGTPATPYVRDAIAGGRSGLYHGVTYEGLENYTAFTTSRLTGWSTHVAVPAARLAGASRRATLLTAVAAFTALLLALAIATIAYRQSRARRLEEERDAQSRKLAAVGQLASGIAHDFNNLLMVITHALTRAAARENDPHLRRSLDDALSASERGAALIRQLLAFARSEPLVIEAVDLRALVASIEGLLRQSIGPDVVLAIQIADDARWVSTHASQLEMALVNLAVNARDAMPGGGALTVCSRPTKGHRDFIDLDISDTGEGMSQAVIDRAMEPFFTTKPAGRGTGLGLAQVFGVVSQSRGTVEIRSRLGEGTTVTLRLPRSTPTPPDKVSATAL